ncbi:MAG: NAD-dependent epimerase/dehydratase family protein [Clostridia bacterium]|nr:NAD-dependent epimerase/dehydratase family protein [Clostridia bacterium]
MKVLVTGANGFVGRSLCAELENIASGKRRDTLGLTPLTVMKYDVCSTWAELEAYAREADFCVHLAGVNRPKDAAEFETGNADLTKRLTALLRGAGGRCGLLLSSSTQAALQNPYGASKRAAEGYVREYSRECGAPAFVFRFPNLFGKWCRPNYNSVVATFCHNIANGLPIRVDDEGKLMTLAYIDDVVDEMIACIAGRRAASPEPRPFEVTHEATLGQIRDLLYSFRDGRRGLLLPDVSDPFTKKLYSTYLSYVPACEAGVPCETKRDERGGFTELIRTDAMGQVSVNTVRPGFTKGNHWHHTKTEKFIVVSGRGVIRQRRVGDASVCELPVCGGEMTSVDMLPGYTHSIENTGEDDLVFIIWANERFDPERPDTYYEPVLIKTEV